MAFAGANPFPSVFGAWPPAGTIPGQSQSPLLPLSSSSALPLPSTGTWNVLNSTLPKQPLPAFGSFSQPITPAVVVPSQNAFSSFVQPTAQTTVPSQNAFGSFTLPVAPVPVTTVPVPSHNPNMFGPFTPSMAPPPALSAQTDKNAILNCMTESKNIQIAILNELKTMSMQMQNKIVSQDQPIIIKPTHLNVSCNCCGSTNITGVRYKCMFCPDFDLCEICEANTNTHDPLHIFLKIKDNGNLNATIESYPAFKKFMVPSAPVSVPTFTSV